MTSYTASAYGGTMGGNIYPYGATYYGYPSYNVTIGNMAPYGITYSGGYPPYYSGTLTYSYPTFIAPISSNNLYKVVPTSIRIRKPLREIMKRYLWRKRIKKLLSSNHKITLRKSVIVSSLYGNIPLKAVKKCQQIIKRYMLRKNIEIIKNTSQLMEKTSSKELYSVPEDFEFL